MKARFASVCAACGDKIAPGKEISKNNDEQWVHAHCVEGSDSLP